MGINLYEILPIVNNLSITSAHSSFISYIRFLLSSVLFFNVITLLKTAMLSFAWSAQSIVAVVARWPRCNEIYIQKQKKRLKENVYYGIGDIKMLIIAVVFVSKGAHFAQLLPVSKYMYKSAIYRWIIGSMYKGFVSKTKIKRCEKETQAYTHTNTKWTKAMSAMLSASHKQFSMAVYPALYTIIIIILDRIANNTANEWIYLLGLTRTSDRIDKKAAIFKFCNLYPSPTMHSNFSFIFGFYVIFNFNLIQFQFFAPFGN